MIRLWLLGIIFWHYAEQSFKSACTLIHTSKHLVYLAHLIGGKFLVEFVVHLGLL